MVYLLLMMLFHTDVVPGIAAAVLPTKDKYFDNLTELLNLPS